jgi:hypothetical protein
MSIITYVAQARGITISGNTAGSTYEFEIGFMAFDKTYNSPKTQHRSLDGTIETILQRIDSTVALTIGPYESGSKELIVDEFIKSVAGGETFLIDIDGALGAPINQQQVKLSDKKNKKTRIGNRLYSLPLNIMVV